MYIVEVMPIVKGLPIDTLTYYSKDIIDVGDMVSIDIANRKNINAIAIDVDQARNKKQSIKASDWNTKKINNILAKKIIDKDLLRAIYKTAIKHNTPPSTLLSLLFTKKLWDNILGFQPVEKLDINLHIYSSKKEIPKVNNKINSITNGINKIATVNSTPCLDALLTHKVDKIILHNTRSKYYIHPHYKLNMLDLIEGTLSGALYQVQHENESYNIDKVHIIQDEFEYISPLISSLTDRLIRNVYDNHKGGGKGKILIYTNRKGESPLSRCYDCGLDLLCPECKLPLVLHKKNTKSGEEEKFYLCHHCKYKVNIENEKNIESYRIDMAGDEARSAFARQITCEHCGGWRIMPIGISTGSTYNHLVSHYDFLKKGKINTDVILPIFTIDRDVASTDKKVNRILATWNAEGGILVSNDIGIEDRSIKDLSADYSIIISLDGLFSLPDIDIDIKALDILHNINRMTRNSVYMHTHLMDTSLVKLIKEIENIKTREGAEELINNFIKKHKERKDKLEKLVKI